jgi:hypothetical protein
MENKTVFNFMATPFNGFALQPLFINV